MKTVLPVILAFMLASTGAAVSKTKSYVISLGGEFCVKANVNVKGTGVTANENDSCQTYFGEGFVGAVKGSGKVAIIGGQSSQYPGYEITITLQYPFVTGGSYTVYATSDGVTMTTLGSGNYTVE